MNSITTHVLDLARGRPASGVPVALEARNASPPGWTLIGRGATDEDGRLRSLVPEGTSLSPGVYRLTFDSAAYFGSAGVEGFYPEVTILFTIADPAQHHHVPLLLSPYGYSTYRGS